MVSWRPHSHKHARRAGRAGGDAIDGSAGGARCHSRRCIRVGAYDSVYVQGAELASGEGGTLALEVIDIVPFVYS